MINKYFIKQIDINKPVEKIFSWHEKPGAFERLTPPWMKLKNIYKTGDGIKAGAKVNMDICFANIPFPIKAEHIGYEKNIFFKDRLYGGIFSKWEHTHTFKTPHPIFLLCGFSRLEDRIDYALPFHIPDKWHTLIRAELYRLFNYRHTVMATDLEHHQNCPKPLTILISGASGLVGNTLIPFLTTGGHRVIKLVRRKPKNCDEIEWNPYTGELNLNIELADKNGLSGKIKPIDKTQSSGKINSSNKIDVVINLNGYHIGSSRWTDKTKDMIIKSRTLSTTLLADRISALPDNLKPELFISASATGFYGDRGDLSLNENSANGDLFISKVCSEWEQSAKKAQDAGIRTVFARIGMVLTPAGGALERLLPGFMMGLGAKIGTSKQYMSWISIDDLVYALHHIINNNFITGAVNLVSPNPVINEDFTQTLAKVLSRPAPFTLPASLIRMVWGEMGQELLLSSTKVEPAKLIDSGFRFSYPNLEQALRHILGKTKQGNF